MVRDDHVDLATSVSHLAAAAVAVLSLGGDAARADEACKLAKNGSPMSKPCAEGGIKKAKQAMKTLVRDARKAGVKIECDECHKDPARYDVIADDARAKLDKLLKAASPPAKASRTLTRNRPETPSVDRPTPGRRQAA